MDVVETCINCLAVHVYDVLTLTSIGLLDSILHVLLSLVDRNDIGQLEECSLKDGVGTSCAEADLLGKSYSVAGVELNVVLCDVSLYLVRKVFLEFFVVPYAVQEEVSAGLNVLYHFILVKVG